MVAGDGNLRDWRALMKVANDMRWLASGRVRAGRASCCPRTSRLFDHAWKGQPDAAGSHVMVCIEVIGADNAVALAGAREI